MSCNAFASVINENASCDLAVAPKSVRLPSSTVRCWRKMVSMMVCETSAQCRKKFSIIRETQSKELSPLDFLFLEDAFLAQESGVEILTSSCTRSWMSSKTRTDGAS